MLLKLNKEYSCTISVTGAYMSRINSLVTLAASECQISAIRAMGSGGQNVNKVSSAIHLRFDIQNSAMDIEAKGQLLKQKDNRLSKEGVLIIKGQSYRTQEQNKADALLRLEVFIREAMKIQKTRRATRPTLASKRRRVESKKKHAQTKQLRKKPE